MRIMLALLLCLPAFGAVTSATIWELRSAGTTTSGGGFDSTIASAGTDMSIFDNKNAAGCTSCQSATVNISTADAVTNTTTTVTSATGNFSSALIGNTIYLAGGGTTTGWYQVTAVGGATSITVDRATGGAGGSAQTMNIGGAIGGTAAQGIVTLEIATNGIQAGNIAYVKAGGWGASTATNTFSIAGTAGLPITYIGYTSSRTDSGQVTIQTATNSVVIFNVTGAHRKFYNFIAERTAGTSVKGFSTSIDYTRFQHCKALNTTGAGFEFASSGFSATCVDCYATGVSGSGAFLTVASSSGGAGLVCIGCVAMTNSVTGFVFSNTSTAGARQTCIRCISANNTGTSDGYLISGAGPVLLMNSIAYANTDGLEVSTANNQLVLWNSIFVNNTGVGLKSSTDYSTSGRHWTTGYNAFYGNGTAKTNAATTDDITITGDPFTSSTDFILNSTAGAGAALKNVGWPGALQAGGTSTGLDVGALQTAPTGAAATQSGYTWVQ